MVPPVLPRTELHKKYMIYNYINSGRSFSLIFLFLSLYITLFRRSAFPWCIGYLSLFTFPFLEDDNRGHVIVHFVIDKRGGTTLQLLKHTDGTISGNVPGSTAQIRQNLKLFLNVATRYHHSIQAIGEYLGIDRRECPRKL